VLVIAVFTDYHCALLATAVQYLGPTCLLDS
jgi:hypothetical protein